MRALKLLTGLAVAATLGWCGYWFVGARALDRVLAEGLARVPQVSAAGHSVAGFPNRFDVTLDQPRIAQGGVEWSAPFLQVFALSYRLNHLLAVFAPDQVLRLSGTELLLHTDDLRASVVMEPGRDLPLREAVLVGTGIEVRAEGTLTRVERLRLASRTQSARVQQVALVVEGLRPDAETLTRLDPAAHWPRHFSLLRLDAEVETDRPLDRHALSGPSPRLERLSMTGFRLGWEGTDIALSGRLTPDAQGVLSGEVVLRVEGWPALLARARASGLLDPGAPGLLGLLLDSLPSEADGDRIEVPLAVVAGDLRLGPLLLGTLPPLR